MNELSEDTATYALGLSDGSPRGEVETDHMPCDGGIGDGAP
jgi:hypothetical protein